VEKKMPQYLSSPYQLLWFEPDDLSIMVVGYLLAMVFGGSAAIHEGFCGTCFT
jgi:hypothetical protein